MELAPPVASNLATNASMPPLFEAGRLPKEADLVVPQAQVLPLLSSATAFTVSLELPPTSPEKAIQAGSITSGCCGSYAPN